MQAFSPPAPTTAPSKDSAQVAAAVCERVRAQNLANLAATAARNDAWNREMAALRTNATARTPPPQQLTGPAAVLHARMQRIVPRGKPVVQKPAPEQREEKHAFIHSVSTTHTSYYEPMARYAAMNSVQVEPQVDDAVTEKPDISNVPASDVARVPAPIAASTLSRTLSLPNVPSHVPASLQTNVPVAATSEPAQSKEAEHLQRPNVISALSLAWSRFVRSIQKKASEDIEKVKGKKLEAGVAVGAAAQALAVFVTSGKTQ